MCFLRYDEELANNDQAGQDLKAKAGVPTTTRGGAAAGKKFSSTWKWENSRLGETFAWRPHTGMPDLGRKWVRLAPNGTNPGPFKKSRICPIWCPSDLLCAQIWHLCSHVCFKWTFYMNHLSWVLMYMYLFFCKNAMLLFIDINVPSVMIILYLFENKDCIMKFNLFLL